MSSGSVWDKGGHCIQERDISQESMMGGTRRIRRGSKGNKNIPQVDRPGS